MADELNTPNHRWYQPQNNILLAANEVSKQFILASGIAKIDAKIINPLFALAEPGVWYDPSDLTTLFQDNAGTTPVTAAGQTVGLMLDKSQGLVLGSELVTNGDFSSATGWTAETGWSIAGGAATKVVSAANANLYQTVSIVAGRSYRVTYTLTYSAGGFQMILGGTASSVKLASGTYSEIIIAGSTNQLISAFGNTAFAGSIDNISVKLLAGNHATQSTSTQRPTYGINPITGTRNLLTRTEEFDNAAWNKANVSVSANTVTAPDGALTADLVTSSAAAGYIYPNSNIFATAGGATYTHSVYIKAGTATSIQLLVAAAATYTGTYNLSTGVASTVSANTTVSMVDVGGGWYRCIITCGSVANNAYTELQMGRVANGLTFSIWGAQLELGSTATAYQKVVSQYEVTQAGVQSASYLAFDGVDDGMVTNTITPAIDKVQVFAGVRKLSDAGRGNIAELGNASLNAWFLNGPSGLGSDYVWATGGSTSTTARFVDTAPTTDVITGIGDISGDVATLRNNGTQVATSAVDQGTGNYLAYPLYLGRRGGSSLPFNGRLYSLITRFGANLTTGQITSTESWVNAKTGAY